MEHDGTGIVFPLGVRAAAGATGIKRTGLDLCLVVFDEPATAAAVFTRNDVRAAPVTVSQAILAQTDLVGGIVINSGCANAATGERGLTDARDMAVRAQRTTGAAAPFLVASTGVIGEYLPINKVVAGIETLSRSLSRSAGEGLARAIMTTDTTPKHAESTIELRGGTARIGGIAKGAGMIAPSMATMIAVLTTDAAVAAPMLGRLLGKVTDETFNQVIVDGEMSTNDCVFLVATGAAGVALEDDDDIETFSAALHDLCEELTKAIARDGEGATKLITIEVDEADTPSEARTVARRVALSPLVKTAVHGADPNWGRVLSAVGALGLGLDERTISISFGDVTVYADGATVGVPDEVVKETLQGTEVSIRIGLGRGSAAARAYGCDLSAEYVKINASYRS